MCPEPLSPLAVQKMYQRLGFVKDPEQGKGAVADDIGKELSRSVWHAVVPSPRCFSCPTHGCPMTHNRRLLPRALRRVPRLFVSAEVCTTAKAHLSS
eukprot:jgi/Tetstr1/430330/TSEL_020155.t1